MLLAVIGLTRRIWAQVPVLDLEKGDVEWTMKCITEDEWQSFFEEYL